MGEVSEEEELEFGVRVGDWRQPVSFIIIAGVILYYLNTPDVKRAFGRA